LENKGVIMKKRVKFEVLLFLCRRVRKLSMREAAHKIGISRRLLAYLESGERKPTRKALDKIVKFYGHKFDFYLACKQIPNEMTEFIQFLGGLDDLGI